MAMAKFTGILKIMVFLTHNTQRILSYIYRNRNKIHTYYELSYTLPINLTFNNCVYVLFQYGSSMPLTPVGFATLLVFVLLLSASPKVPEAPALFGGLACRTVAMLTGNPLILW